MGLNPSLAVFFFIFLQFCQLSSKSQPSLGFSCILPAVRVHYFYSDYNMLCDILWTNVEVETQVSLVGLLLLTQPLLLPVQRSTSHWVTVTLADNVEHAALVKCVLKNKSLMVLPVDLAANPHLFFVTPKVLK